MHRTTHIAVLTLFALSPLSQHFGRASTTVHQPQRVTLLEYSTTVPAGWTSRPATSKMRLAEFVLPSSGEKAPEVIVYFFGSGQGGSVDANLERWKSQFSNPNGSPVTDVVTHENTGTFPLTIAEYRGTYARGIGMGSAPEAALADHMLIAVVADTPHGTLFFQLFGPRQAVETRRSTYLAFVRGLK